ncbi:MAG: 1-deoxy-D-xylulose-5-phosphate reductoisomerase [Sphingomonadaceae bacterium]|nr:1-deoxy-D-xylulose-5-phosphate reductoisomerase [Sphingomonadaceae bacterium]
MGERKRISILGATGSVGQSTLDLIERNRTAYEIVALTAYRDVEGLAKAAIAYGAKHAAIGDAERADALASALSETGITTAAGPEAICEAAAMEADWIMAAIVGCAGLKPVMAAVEQGSTVVLANKEPLVSAGDVVLAAAKIHGATILPADSEHNAIFQCFDFERPEGIRRIVLTASGGPFLDRSIEEMRAMTPDQAVAHPNWSMGAKISVDSATLMNKGLELIEADRLFPIAADRIEIIVHRQSVVHSMVEYADGSILAQLGPPDMRTPIAHTLAWPDRMETPMPSLDFAAISRLDFEEPDPVRFPALRLARQSLDRGGAKPAILNAANEEAVAAFLDKRIGFLDIAAIVEDMLDRYDPPAPGSLDDVFAIDTETRMRTRQMMTTKAA